MAKEILLNAFNMNCVGHINHGMWTHPRDTSADYNTLSYWTGLAKTLEAGLFDGLFIADIVGTYDVYGGGIGLTAHEAIQLPVNDPTLIVPAMAAVTRDLGFGVTVNVSSEQPYTFARRFSTLDHLTDGRVGWNIVTGYLDSAARAVGRGKLTEHDRRYDIADEYLDVLYQLWEGSWRDGAVLRDREGRRFIEPSRLRAVAHKGEFYDVQGYHLCEPSRQRTPVLYQAGSSGRGKRFAARHAECVFINARTPADARATSRAIRAELVQAGRLPGDVKIFVGITVIPAATTAEAKDRHAEYLGYSSPEAGLAHFSAGTGIDFARFGLDDPIDYGGSNGVQSQAQAAGQRRLTKRDLLTEMAIGGRYPAIVGSGVEVADHLQRFIDEGEVDGFNLTRVVAPESYEDFIAHVIPELQTRGAYKTAYREGTLRQKLFGQGDHLPLRHPGGQVRAAAAPLAAE